MFCFGWVQGGLQQVSWFQLLPEGELLSSSSPSLTRWGFWGSVSALSFYFFFFPFFAGWPIWKCWFPKFFWALLTSIRPTPPMWLGFCCCCGWLVGLSQEGANMARSSSFAGDEGTHVSTRGGPFQYLDSLRYRLHLCFDLAIKIFSFLPFGAGCPE